MIGARWLAALGVVIVAASQAAPVSAQDSTAKRDSAVARLRTGQQIRLSAEGMARLTGRAGVALNDTLDVAQDDAVRRIPIPAIDTLWVRGGSAKTGALIGAGAMVVLYFIALAEYDHYCEGSCDHSATEVAGGIVLSGAFGAGLGALIGGAVQSWKRKYP
jgi:hypothetical protein